MCVCVCIGKVTAVELLNEIFIIVYTSAISSWSSISPPPFFFWIEERYKVGQSLHGYTVDKVCALRMQYCNLESFCKGHSQF